MLKLLCDEPAEPARIHRTHAFSLRCGILPGHLTRGPNLARRKHLKPVEDALIGRGVQDEVCQHCLENIVEMIRHRCSAYVTSTLQEGGNMIGIPYVLASPVCQ
jgi:hypothetical protein